MTTLLWIVAVAMIVIGIVGTVLPALPGAVFVLGGSSCRQAALRSGSL